MRTESTCPTCGLVTSLERPSSGKPREAYFDCAGCGARRSVQLTPVPSFKREFSGEKVPPVHRRSQRTTCPKCWSEHYSFEPCAAGSA
jgi:hypothetical protein